ncbi:MAG: hypothetical protein AAF610_01820 [Pseudomonadota bacterium]
MDTNTAYCIVSSVRGRHHRTTRKVTPYFSTLYQAVRALKFLRERLTGDEHLHIEQTQRPTERHDG